jgi:acetyltransferase-like isoleucine patch superfamily enzyme
MEPKLRYESGTAEAHLISMQVRRAIRVTEQLNRLPYEEAASIREVWAELTGQVVDETFHLIPPVYSEQGRNIRVGRNVFINQGCTLNDIGGITIGDDVMLGPNVSLITSGHPLDPATRRKVIVASPIVLERNVWVGAGATVMHGVTIGADAVVAAGAVVTRDVPEATVVAGAPARVIGSVHDEDGPG